MTYYAYPLEPGESRVVLTLFGPPDDCDRFWDYVYKDDNDILSYNKVFPVPFVPDNPDFADAFKDSVWGTRFPLYRQCRFSNRCLSFVCHDNLFPVKLLDYVSSVFPELFFLVEYVFLPCYERSLLDRTQGIRLWHKGNVLIDMSCCEDFGDVLLDRRDFLVEGGRRSYDYVSSADICIDTLSLIRTSVLQHLVYVSRDKRFFDACLHALFLPASLGYKLFTYNKLSSLASVISRTETFLSDIVK